MTKTYNAIFFTLFLSILSCSPKTKNSIKNNTDTTSTSDRETKNTKNPASPESDRTNYDECSIENSIVPENYTKPTIEDIHEVVIVAKGSSRGNQEVWNSLSATAHPVHPNYQFLDTQLDEVDAKLKIRVVALEAPSQDLDGELCYQNSYSSLKLTVGIARYENGQYSYLSEEIDFNGIKVNECSTVKSFNNIPHGRGKIFLYIKSPQSDYEYLASGNNSRPQYSNIITRACWKIKLQFSTDFTKDFQN